MELFAIKYAENYKYATYNTIYREHKSVDLVPGFIFLIYIAKFKDKILLFDTGFRSKKTAEYYGIHLIEVNEELAHILGDKDSVDTIFITHVHFDHSDNLDLYPNAKIVIAKAEYDSAMNKYSGTIRNLLSSNQVHIVEDEYIYDNIFQFKVIGGHSEGSSVIYFGHDDKQYVIAGDECYYINNVIENIPNGMVCNSEKNDRFIADAHRRHLITLPYHDDKIFQEYPNVSEHIVRII